MDRLSRLRSALAGRYAVERELGSGGMATVYLADDLKHRRKVAVKVLRQELAASLGADRFLLEATIAAQLQHPHILPLYDSGEADGFLYYVMPYVEGETLRDKLAREGPPPIPETIRILREVVDALTHAHAHGVIHRDIKPANVLLSGRHALVGDFGVAKAVSEATSQVHLTGTGVALGTPAYMAPEQGMADPRVDHRADIYAVGVLGYELLTGHPPFTGTTPQALLAAHATMVPEPISTRRPEVPPELERLVMRCLEKDPAKRWPSAESLLAGLEALEASSGGSTPVGLPAARTLRAVRLHLLPIIGAVIVVLGLAGLIYRARARAAAEVNWVRQQALPEIARLADSGQREAAFRLALRARELLPEDSALAAIWPRFSMPVNLRTEPSGARLYWTEYSASDSAWQYLGTTPLDSTPLPFGFSRLRFEKAGFRSLDAAAIPWLLPDVPFVLEDTTTPSDGTVRVPGGEVDINLPGLDHLKPIELGAYRIGRHEVTNGEFRQFIEAGGYRTRELWEHPFVLAGKALSWEDALARFTDRTGRPGPSGWEAGDYPSGEKDYPVTGVSWYEAAAYAKYRSAQLPTIYHWSRAAFTWASSGIVPLSNLAGQGPAPVGRYRGMGPYGTYDMAGNAREWCHNQTGGERYILGGGWNDPSYAFNDAYAQSPFDRSPTNGFRLVRYLDDRNLDLASRPIDRLFRDFAKERPVPDQVFEIYRRMYDYDRTALNSAVEAVDSSAEGWVREKVSFAAAYGNERVTAYLFLPRQGRPPFQALVYFPGSNAIHDRSSSQSLQTWTFDFIVKSGRAVVYPVYKSTYERGDSLRSDYAEETNAYKDHVIMWAKDLRRSIDYLATRADIDSARLAYYGVSWGGYLGGLMPAVEPRLKASVLVVAGLEFQRGFPEVEPINFLPRIRVPVLMLNGQYDHYFPVESSQQPFFDLLGTLSENKRMVVSEGGHTVPRTLWIRETLDWLDRYLGPVQ